MVIGPKVGSYSLKFEGDDVDAVAVVATTPYYPADGRGGFSDTDTVSFVRDADLSLITFIVGSLEAQNAILTFWDEDDKPVFRVERTSAVSALEPIIFGEFGPILQGNWYVTSTDTTPEWSIGFKVLSSR